MKNYRPFLFIITTFFLFTASHLSAQNLGPSETLQSFIETLKSFDFPIADSSAHTEKVKLANQTLDLESMGKKALEAHWTAATPEQQKQFMDLLWKLIENIAYPRSKTFLEKSPVEYGDPKSLDKGIEIKTTVKNEDPSLNAEIVYDLAQENGQWKIYDIFLDGVTMTEDLKFQFDKIIGESSFDGLLNRMKERLAKAEAENAKK